jgi:succinyl-CoA synthetase beta subunit
VEYAEFLGRIDQVAVFATDRPKPTRWPAPPGRLSEAGARQYLAPLGIRSPRDRLATSAAEAVVAFEALGEPMVALKVQSPDLAHKTDIGGVRLGLRTSDEVRLAFDDIVLAVRAAQPRASVEGVLVQGMAPAGGVETLVAARRDPLLGPMVVVGIGGVEVEAFADVAMRLAPVTLAEARAMIAELRGSAMLRGIRGRPPADVDALATTLMQVSELAVALPPNVTNIEINPLLVLPVGGGVLMLDAAIEIEEGQEP